MNTKTPKSRTPLSIIARLLIGGLIGGTAYWLWRYFAPENSDLMLEERVVVITGATSSMGRALAMSFARRGMRVVLVDQRKERLAVVEREITPYADAVLAIQADITNAKQRERLLNKILKSLGGIDILINNAGMTATGLLENHPVDRIEEIIITNLTSTILLTRQVLPLMLSQEEGYIVNISSGLARLAPPAAAPYVASTFGLAGFSDSLRRELTNTHIHVLHVVRDWTLLEMLSADQTGMIEKLFPRYIIDKPEVVAEKIVTHLVRGSNEVVFGSWMRQVVLFFERTFPIITRFYWRRVFPRWLELMKKAEEKPSS
jgi:short-subunit dehydrogenase